MSYYSKYTYLYASVMLDRVEAIAQLYNLSIHYELDVSLATPITIFDFASI